MGRERIRPEQCGPRISADATVLGIRGLVVDQPRPAWSAETESSFTFEFLQPVKERQPS
jgi:hypothetical protein